jgi:hypothetical protein
MSAAAMAARAAQARAGAIQPKDVTPPGVIVKHAPELRDANVASMLTPEAYETLAAETLGGLESARQVPRRPLGDLPLVVLTARRSFEAFAGSGIPIEESNAIWLTLQNELASLSKSTQHVFSDGDHRLNESDPAAVIRAIELAIAAVKGRSGVPPALVPFGPGHMVAAHQKCPLDHGRRIRSTLWGTGTDVGHLSIRPFRAR